MITIRGIWFRGPEFLPRGERGVGPDLKVAAPGSHRTPRLRDRRRAESTRGQVAPVPKYNNPRLGVGETEPKLAEKFPPEGLAASIRGITICFWVVISAG